MPLIYLSAWITTPFPGAAFPFRTAKGKSYNYSYPELTLGGRPYVLEETTWATVRETEYSAAVLPWGATEAHNYHLPYGTDNYESEYVATAAARMAWERGARVVVLPTIPFGVNTGQLDIRLTINMNPGTQSLVLHDIVRSLENQNVPKLVIVNSHGGNDFRQIIRELQGSSSVFIASVNWWSCMDPAPFYDTPGDHAGELETSVMMEIAPDLVLPLEKAGPGRARKFRIAGLNDGTAWTPRRWTQVTDDTGSGDPTAASREKGARHLEAVTARIADLLVDIADADVTQLYE
ncbi:MAG TPA: creatininase family protein [Gemmatimonadaceae bacterium]|nr:creatininase family protein [Gemmatimonadaceae bacterium]